jgi:hypothetical protein
VSHFRCDSRDKLVKKIPAFETTMRIIYKEFSGRRHCREFNDWRQMCVWLKRFYPFIKLAEQAGEIARS